MELLTIAQAADQANVSDKTLRRAIESGALIVQPKLHKNSKIMIDSKQLEAYIASRQPMSNAVQTPDDNQVQERLTAMQEQIETLMSRVAELESLEHRVQELEKMLLSLAPVQDDHRKTEVPTPENGTIGHVQTVTKRHTKKEKEATFEFADFSHSWQDLYDCRALKGDVKAVWRLQPYTEENTSGNVYHVTYLQWETTTIKRKISDELRERGIALQQELSEQALAKMLENDWYEVGKTQAGKFLYKRD